MSFRDAHALDWGGVYKQTNAQKLISNPNLLTSPPFSSLVLLTTLMDSNHIPQINHTSTQFGQNVLDLGTFSKRIRSKCFDIVAF
jgi:predicted nicotinamide N-methyase